MTLFLRRPARFVQPAPRAISERPCRLRARARVSFAAELSSISCARRASDSGKRSATTGWILPARSSSSSAPEVLTEPVLVGDAQLLDPITHHPPAGRECAPEPDDRGRRPPLDPPAPALAPLRHRVVVADHDQPAAGSPAIRSPVRNARKERSDTAPPMPSSTTSTPLPPVTSRTRARKSSFR